MKRKINWAIPGLFAMIIVIVAVATAQSLSVMSPEPTKLASQCGSCHGMDKQVQSWQHSSHKDVACTACHADPGAAGWVTAKLDQVAMVLNARSGDVDLSKIVTAVPNERCIACHAQQMPYVMQDLKPSKLDANYHSAPQDKSKLEFLPAAAGHDVHLTGENPLKCVDCHVKTSHGAETQAGKVDDWHNVCLNCHAEQKVALPVRNSVSCSACHVQLEKVAPADHNSDAFRKSHGQAANQSGANCQQCHMNPGLTGQSALGPHGLQPVSLTTTTTVTDNQVPVPKMPPGVLTAGPNVQDACASCHGITMPHPQDFLKDHAKGFKDNPDLCASCHGTKDQGFNMQFSGNPRTLSTTDPTCTSCHAQPMPHPENWLGGGHQAAATSAPQTCEQCHSSKNKANPNSDHSSPQYCLSCHLSRFSHPVSFVATHGKEVAKYGGSQSAAGCTQCHTSTVNSCTACHTGGVGSKTEWHPSNWVASHKNTLASFKNNPAAAGCTACHTTSGSGDSASKVSCTDCHKSSSNFQQQWHPADWVGSHKNSLASYNGDPSAAGCTQCHSLTEKSASITACAVCHTSGVGNKQQWHPANWWISHAQTTKPADEATCATCHTYIQPSCSKCHTKR